MNQPFVMVNDLFPISACIFGCNRAIELRKHPLIPAEVAAQDDIWPSCSEAPK